MYTFLDWPRSLTKCVVRTFAVGSPKIPKIHVRKYENSRPINPRILGPTEFSEFSDMNFRNFRTGIFVHPPMSHQRIFGHPPLETFAFCPKILAPTDLPPNFRTGIFRQILGPTEFSDFSDRNFRAPTDVPPKNFRTPAARDIRIFPEILAPTDVPPNFRT